MNGYNSIAASEKKRNSFCFTKQSIIDVITLWKCMTVMLSSEIKVKVLKICRDYDSIVIALDVSLAISMKEKSTAQINDQLSATGLVSRTWCV